VIKNVKCNCSEAQRRWSFV